MRLKYYSIEQYLNSYKFIQNISGSHANEKKIEQLLFSSC